MKKIAVIGNGAIGSKLALDLASKGDIEITLFGGQERRGSASKAAGAMINVFSELEVDQFEHAGLKTKFQMGHYSLKFWGEYIQTLEEKTGIRIRTGTGCKIIKNEGTTPYELETHNYLAGLAKDFPDDLLVNDDGIYIKSEFCIDSRAYLEALDLLIAEEPRISFVNYTNSYIFNTANDFNKSIFLSNNLGDHFGRFDNIIIAAGSFSNDIIKSDQFLFGNVQPIFYGIGSALRFYNVPVNAEGDVGSGFTRTMNRGGACGFHVVPCNGYSYFGATNSINFIPEFDSRVESLSILSRGLVEEFGIEYKKSPCKPIVGFRPTPLDSFPLIGKMNSCPIYFATGTKRDGLTASIYISDFICNQIAGAEPKDPDYYSQIDIALFQPERELLSYFDKKVAIEKAAKNRVAGRVMHSRELMLAKDWDDAVEKETENVANIYNKLKITLPPSFGIHPELINMFEYSRS